MQYVQQRMYTSSNRRGHDTRKWKFARRMSDSRRGHEENKMSFIELSDKRILRQKSRFTIETQSVKEKAGNGIISYSRISDSGRRDKRRQRSNKDRIEEREACSVSWDNVWWGVASTRRRGMFVPLFALERNRTILSNTQENIDRTEGLTTSCKKFFFRIKLYI